MQIEVPQGLTLLAVAVAIALPLERLLPVHRQPILRAQVVTDALHLVLTSALSKVFVQLLSVALLATAIVAVDRLTGLAALKAVVAAQPFALQFVEAMVTYEFFGYWSHRASHEWRWWWRFHSIHHSSTTLDWLATPRLHFVDQGLRQFVKLTPLVLLGFTKASFGLVAIVGPVLTFLIHSNVRLQLGPFRYLYTSPQFHHWHHALAPIDKNYSDQFPWLDALFGTLHLPRGRFPDAYGIVEPVPASWWAQVLHPFRTLRSGPSAAGVRPADRHTRLREGEREVR